MIIVRKYEEKELTEYLLYQQNKWYSVEHVQNIEFSEHNILYLHQNIRSETFKST